MRQSGVVTDARRLVATLVLRTDRHAPGRPARLPGWDSVRLTESW